MAVLLHVDMDAFFASVELLHHPEWRGKPLIVGALADERGVVSTCSYEARVFGVHSAMPSRTAYKLCPHAVFTHPHMALYEEASERAFEIFRRFTPYVEAVSIDEAFLDITGSIHLYGSAERLGQSLRSSIREELGLTCSVGIAPNRLLAKIGSEARKPDGLTVMPFDRPGAEAFLAPKKISTLWGVGKKTQALLKPYGITLCRDIQRLDTRRLATILGSENAAETLKAYAAGTSSDTVRWRKADEQSVSREYTFDSDETDRGRIRARLLELVSEVGKRFRTEERWARTARLKLRDGDFNTITRQTPFNAPSRDDFSFREKALELFEREKTGYVRLIGFGVANLQRTDGTGETLFPDPAEEKRRKLEKLSATIDRLRERGMSPVTLSTDRGEPPVSGGNCADR